MPKEYIYGEEISPDGTTRQEAKVTWSPVDSGGIVQMTVFKSDGTYRNEYELPQYMTLDRPAINRLIKVLRRARDQAYGRDE